MKINELLWQIRLFFITFFGFFVSVFLLILLLPFIIVFWVISEIMYCAIRLKLGNTFIRPNGLDIIQGLESHRSRPFITTVTRYEGKIDMDRFCKKFDNELMNIKAEDGTLRYIKLSKIFQSVYGFHVFKDVEEGFDIRNQVRYVDARDLFPERGFANGTIGSTKVNGTVDSTNVNGTVGSTNANGTVGSANGSERKTKENSSTIEWELMVERFMEKYGSSPTKPGHPQWELIVITEEKHTTLVFRIFHSYCDGVYFLRFLLQYIGDKPVECRLPYNYHQPSYARKFLDCFWAFCLLPFGLYRLAFSYEKNPLHGPDLSGDKMFLISKPVELDILKKIKNESKTTMNAIIFSCMSNAFATHFQKTKSTVENVIILVPVSLQDLGRPIKLKNRFGLIGVLLPTFLDKNAPLQNSRSPSSAIERLVEVQASCDRSKNDPSFLAIHWMLVFICSLLPSRLIDAMFTSKGLTTSMSNVVGPQDEEFLFTDAPMTDMMFWIPDRSPLGMGISVSGFAGKIRMGLMVDKVLMGTKEEGYAFVNAFMKEIQTLYSEISSKETHTVSIPVGDDEPPKEEKSSLILSTV